MADAATVAQALGEAQARGIARLDAQLLLLHGLGRSAAERAWLIAHDGEALPADAQQRFEQLCQRRLTGEPVAYLVGSKEFYGLTLQVDARVLVPRPETEGLVAWALEVLQGYAQPRVLDLGTGSGAIALAIKSQRTDANVEAVDASEAALAVAAANGQALGLAVQWRCASWLAGATSGYPLILSNPPYVAEQDAHLSALLHEPRSALVAGEDGLRDLRALAAEAPVHLAPGGWLLLEHGWDQAEAVRALLRAAGLVQVQSRRDLAGIERVSGGMCPGAG